MRNRRATKRNRYATDAVNGPIENVAGRSQQRCAALESNRARDGGTPQRLMTGTATNPVWSPDGALIVYTDGRRTGRFTCHRARRRYSLEMP